MTNIPRNLLVADRIVLGLTRAQLITVAVAAVAGYGAWRALGLAGLPVAALVVAGGLVFAVGVLDGQPLQDWLGLAVRWLPRRRPRLLEVNPC